MMQAMLRRLFARRGRSPDPEAECFRSFFHEKFGHPGRQFTLSPDGEPTTIDVAVHRVPWDRSVYALVSVGLSTRTRRWGDPVEVMLLVDDLPWDAERAFRRVVGLLAVEPAALAIGNIYGGRESLGDIARRFGKTAMVLTTPTLGDESLVHVECGGTPGHVLLLVPITDSERRVIDEGGLEAFEARLQGADVSDLDRASVA